MPGIMGTLIPIFRHSDSKLKKSSFSEEERKLNNERYQKEKKVKLMKYYGLR